MYTLWYRRPARYGEGGLLQWHSCDAETASKLRELYDHNVRSGGVHPDARVAAAGQAGGPDAAIPVRCTCGHSYAAHTPACSTCWCYSFWMALPALVAGP